MPSNFIPSVPYLGNDSRTRRLNYELLERRAIVAIQAMEVALHRIHERVYANRDSNTDTAEADEDSEEGEEEAQEGEEEAQQEGQTDSVPDEDAATNDENGC